MKKSFVALAVLGAFAGTSMAAEVTMYGVVDTGLLYQHREASASIDGIGSASAEVDSFSMEPGTNSASRFGIRGTEDLGNGMTVGFKLENGFESGTGALKTDSKLFDRESTLFIKGGFGTVYAGRMGTLVSDAGSVGFYGSMASAISADPKDRAELSTWRTIGSTLASLVIGVGTPMVAYVTVNGQTVLSGSRMTIIAGVFSVCAILCYLLCFNLVRERVDVPANNSKMDIGKMLKSVFTNRALLGIIAAALFLLLAMLTMQGMAGYVFPNFYGSAAAQSTASLLSSVLILLVCAPFASKLASRFGKKELATVSCIVATVLEVICFVLKPANVWVYVGFFCAAFICLGFFNTIIWAMITDVIDDSEVRNGIREDGTIYAVYSFARKLGQAFSSGLTGGLLTMIGYSAATAFDPEVTMGIFNISCIAPAIGFVAVALSLFFIYPLTKQKVEENVAALAQRHNK